MRPECIKAVTAAAEGMGRKLAAGDFRLIEDRIKGARVNLARQDVEAYRDMTPQQQVEAAAQRVAQEIMAEKVLKKQREAQAIQKTYALNQTVDAMVAQSGESRLSTLFRVLFQHSDGKASAFSLENRIRATKKYYHAQLDALFDLGDRGYLGSLFADPEATKALTTELYGKDSGNPLAKQAAQALQKVIDRQINDYRAEGGVLNALEDWRHPQYTSPRLADRMGRDPWVAFVRTKLDRSKYLKEDGSPLSDVEFTAFLEASWRSIALDGAGKTGEGNVGQQGTGALGNQRKAHRQLFFKDAEAWGEYHAQLGEKDMFSIMIDHVDGMASDIAAMRVLSHNPKAMLKSLIDDAAAKDAAEYKGGVPKGLKELLTSIFGAKGAALFDDKVKLERAFDYMLGGLGQRSETRTARFFRGYRNLKVGSLLGSLPFSMLPDQGTMKSIGRQNQVAAGLIWQGQQQWASHPAFRENLRAMGLALEGAGEELSRLGERNGNVGATGKMATAVHRLSGATAINTMERSAMEFGLTATWGRLVAGAKTIDDLHPEDAKILRTKGLTDTDWQVWKLAEQDELDGVNLLTPRSIDMIPTAQIKAAIPDKIEAIEKETADVVARLEGQNAKEDEWIANRAQKLDQFQEKAAGWLSDFKATREKAQNDLLAKGMADIAALRNKRGDETAEAAKRNDAQAEKLKGSLEVKLAESSARAEVRVDLLKAETARAEVEADIATYLRTAKGIESQRRLLQQVEEGANSEKLAPGAKRKTEDLVRFQGRKGESLGARRERADAAVRTLEAQIKRLEKENEAKLEAQEKAHADTLADLEKRADKDSAKLEIQYARRLQEVARKADKEIAAKEKDLAERAYKRMFELADFTKNARERMARRAEIAESWQAQVGAKIERAAELAKQEAILKLYGALDGEVNTAVLQPSVLDNFGLKTGGGALNPSSTFGEIYQTVIQFKAFPWAYFRRHYNRMLLENGKVNRAKYALSTMGMTTALAGAGITLGAMFRGEDPEDITKDPADFGRRAFLKGGGLGFYGDIFLTPDQFNSDATDQIFGPVIGDLNLALGAAKKVGFAEMADDPDKERAAAARNLVKLVKGNTPFQNLWYTRAMTDRWLFNNMQEMANPGAMERMKGFAAKKGTTHWWAPGDMAPSRAPDFGKAVGESTTQ